MEISLIITGCITALISIISGIYASFTARKKGPIFSNAYIWGSKKDYSKIDKNAEYRLVTVIFGCISAIFTLSTINIFTGSQWAYILMWLLIIFVMVYAIIDAIKSFKRG